ncbi:hypothetical protein BCV70DRAFT_203229 [Testicularia cyperi]|uniref:CID domain-containing protein n=1 Tax=Testicularia cyperi TaxID=1882483 RepID=A0A317XEG7_9BASI|nr:hypothetical protein BCV70DRAFT_203351 [Testicularia cyperi]PWY97023.1 hypothetical protein BCV70DRAFT_203229 [Testicularia cyperi]
MQQQPAFAAGEPAHDPNAFAGMYRSHLATLTFNSKPIITNLTVLAHEHAARMAGVVAKCIDDHIMHSHPSVRLPALYTLDSISKNIGHPYTQLWSERIVPMFLESYRVVDQPTKRRMEELLVTWKTAGPIGRPLFGDDAQWKIERALFGSQGMPLPQPQQQQQQQQQQYRNTPPTSDPRAHSKAKAIENIDKLLLVDGQALAATPSDQALQERVDSLAQLRQVITTADLSPEEMTQIHAQLDSLAASAAQRALATSTPAPIPLISDPVASPLPTNGSHAPAPSAAPSAPLSQGLSGALANLSSLMGATVSAPTPQTTSASGGSGATSSLIASLMQAGLLPGSGASTPVPEERDQDEEYVTAIMSLDIQTSGPAFQREPPSFELILHKHLPLQCRQCANRYPSGAKGQGRMDDHLDWHFTQNRRAKDSATRGQSRSWFDRLDSFLRGGFDDSAPSSSSKSGAGDDGVGGTGGKSGLTAAQDKALREKFEKTFVIAPTDPDLASKPCPICKEVFKSQWSEDEEEWIWLNAIKVDSAESGATYYHASCHHSAKSLNEAVAGVGRLGTTPGAVAKRRSASRTATPSAASIAGVKRKSETSVSPEDIPVKRSAL